MTLPPFFFIHLHLTVLRENCVKRDVRKAGEEGDWRKKTRDRGGWKRLSDEAVKKSWEDLTPDKRTNRKRERERERSVNHCLSSLYHVLRCPIPDVAVLFLIIQSQTG